MMLAVSSLQNAIETVEQLSADEQVQLIDVVYRRLAEEQRGKLALAIAEGRLAYRTGAVKRGSVDDLLADLDE